MWLYLVCPPPQPNALTHHPSYRINHLKHLRNSKMTEFRLQPEIFHKVQWDWQLNQQARNPLHVLNFLHPHMMPFSLMNQDSGCPPHRLDQQGLKWQMLLLHFTTFHNFPEEMIEVVGRHPNHLNFCQQPSLKKGNLLRVKTTMETSDPLTLLDLWQPREISSTLTMTIKT